MRAKQGGFLKVAVAILILLNLGMMLSFWLGQKPRGGKHKFPSPVHLVERIGFNDEQKAEFMELIEDHKDDTWLIKEELSDTRKELLDLVGENNSEEYQKLLNKIGELQKEQMEALFKHFEQVRALCKNDEQRQRFDELITKSVPGMGGPPGPGPGGPPHHGPPPH